MGRGWPKFWPESPSQSSELNENCCRPRLLTDLEVPGGSGFRISPKSQLCEAESWQLVVADPSPRTFGLTCATLVIVVMAILYGVGPQSVPTARFTARPPGRPPAQAPAALPRGSQFSPANSAGALSTSGDPAFISFQEDRPRACAHGRQPKGK